MAQSGAGSQSSGADARLRCRTDGLAARHAPTTTRWLAARAVSVGPSILSRLGFILPEIAVIKRGSVPRDDE